MTLAAAPEVVMDFLGKRVGDARHRFDVLEGRCAYRTGTAEMVQQRAFARRTDPRHLVERRPGDVGGAAGAMGTDGEAMCLVPQALQEIEDGVARLEREGRLVRHEEALPAGVAIGTLGNADHGDVLDAEL